MIAGYERYRFDNYSQMKPFSMLLNTKLER